MPPLQQRIRFGVSPVGSKRRPLSSGNTNNPISNFALFDGINSNVDLSNGLLTVTHSSNISNSGAASASFKTMGKHYFEIFMIAVLTHGGFDGIGIISETGTIVNFVTDGTHATALYRVTGRIWSNDVYTGKALFGNTVDAHWGFAIDLDNRLGWIRRRFIGGGASSNWNNDVLADPATGVGGVTIQALVGFAPCVGFGGVFTQSGDQWTGNFGQSPFDMTVPTGFYAGWLR